MYLGIVTLLEHHSIWAREVRGNYQRDQSLGPWVDLILPNTYYWGGGAIDHFQPLTQTEKEERGLWVTGSLFLWGGGWSD